MRKAKQSESSRMMRPALTPEARENQLVSFVVIAVMEMRWMMLRCYSELLQIPTFKERYEYLRLDGVVGEETFGFDRYLNQIFYNSQEWKDIRRKIIIRDNGCDLGLDGYEIRGKILIHHMNPIKQQDILLRTDLVLNPEYLIATTLSTHNAIHYGDAKLLLTVPNERRKNDTCPWRH